MREDERQLVFRPAGSQAGRGDVAAMKLWRLAAPANQCRLQVLDGMEGVWLLCPGKNSAS